MYLRDETDGTEARSDCNRVMDVTERLSDESDRGLSGLPNSDPLVVVRV